MMKDTARSGGLRHDPPSLLRPLLAVPKARMRLP